MNKLLSVYAVVVISLFTSFSFALNLNDLTVLLPLPEPSEMNLLLSPEEGLLQGPLLSKTTFDELPQLVPEFENDVTWSTSLKVIGIRLDPCFTEGTGPVPCRRQLRLVWQPVFSAGDTVSTRDAAIHSFYDFDEIQFARLWQRWPKSSGPESAPLQIHPQITREGLKGPYWQQVRSLILETCGEKNLTRMTVMNVMAGEQMWIFMGFDIEQGRPSQIRIPRIQKWSQGVVQGASASGQFSGNMMPPPREDLDFVKLTSDSITTKKQFTEERIKAVIGKVHEYENPLKHNPGTLDCVSCHLANTAHQWGRMNFSTWNWAQDFSNVAFQSSRNLENTSWGPLRTNQLRAFGYFMKWPVFSQRVINETAAAAEGITSNSL